MAVTQAKRRQFLDAVFESGGDEQAAAREHGLNLREVYQLIREDGAFRIAWEQTIQDAYVATAIRRGLRGERKAVRHEGAVVGFDTVHFERTFLAGAKAFVPDKFEERQVVEHTGERRIVHDVATTKADMDKLVSEGLQRLAARDLPALPKPAIDAEFQTIPKKGTDDDRELIEAYNALK